MKYDINNDNSSNMGVYRTDRRSRKKYIIYSVVIPLMLMVSCPVVFHGTAYAETDEADDKKEKGIEDIYKEKGYVTEKDLENVVFAFSKESYTVIESDTVKAEFTCNIPGEISVAECAYTGGGAGIVNYNAVEKTAGITGYFSGTVTVSVRLKVRYCDDKGIEQGMKEYTAETSVTVIPKFTADMTAGEGYHLNYTDYEPYSEMTYVLDDSTCAYISGNDIVAVSSGETSVYLVRKDGSRFYVGRVSVKSNDMAFEEETVNRALGSAPYQLVLNNTEGRQITWSSSAPLIVSVDNLGTVTPVSAGSAVITATVSMAGERSVSYTCNVNVTKPKIEGKASFNIAKGTSVELVLSGTTSKGVWQSSKKSVAGAGSQTSYYYDSKNHENYGDKCTVYAYGKGEAVITVNVDGITLSVKITVTDPKVNKEFCIVVKGGRQVIKVTGINKNSRVTYKSGNKNVATVNSKGIVKARKPGFCPVEVTVDNASFIVSVNVGNPKAVKAVSNALKVEGAAYSQTKRMQKGYYDCSSLVWRSYSPVGMYFGDRHYAPVAANEALYCVKNKMSIPSAGLRKRNSVDKLNVGDLLFFRGSKNGRYKDIYHVAIFMGRECYSFGNIRYTSGRIIHADGARVSQGAVYNQPNCVVIGRPFK